MGSEDATRAAVAGDVGELVTPDEAAHYLRVSRATVYRLLKAGTLRAVRVGRLYRLRRADVLAYGRL